MIKEKAMILEQVKSAAVTTGGGVVVGTVSYVGALTMSDVQVIAAIFAGIMTGLYFFAVGCHTCLKIVWDVQDRRKKK